MNATLDPIAEKARRGEPLTDITVIDAHGHLGNWYQFPIAYSDADAVLRVMDRIGIDALWASGTCAAVGTEARAGNDLMLDAMSRFPGRFHGYCTIYPDDADEALAELLRCEAGGMRALKIHSQHKRPYTDDGYQKAFAHANAKSYPVLAHTWGKELKEIRELAATYPAITWLIGHSAIDPEKNIEIANDFENVVLEICFSKAPLGLVELYVREAGADKVLYGSDIAFVGAQQQIGRVLLSGLSESEKRQVLGLNAARVFRMEV